MARGTTHAPDPFSRRSMSQSASRQSQKDELLLTDDGETRGPTLEEACGERGPLGPWLPQVRMWWETWRNSPNAQVFEATDWRRLAMLAPIVQSYHVKPGAAALSEIRMNEERLGATVVDRQRARIRIERTSETEGAALAEVVDIGNRFEDL